MDALIQIISSGLLLGSMYATGAVGLSLLWGALGMLNMAHGALLTIGGYASFAAVSGLDLHPVLGLPAAMIASFAFGLLLYFAIVRWMYRLPAFETNVIIATIGLAILLENVVLKVFGAYPQSQPFKIGLEKGFTISEIYVPWQNLIIICIAMAMMVVMAWLLNPYAHGPCHSGDSAESGCCPALRGQRRTRVRPGNGARRRRGRCLRRHAELDHHTRADHGLRPYAQGLHCLRHRRAR